MYIVVNECMIYSIFIFGYGWVDVSYHVSFVAINEIVVFVIEFLVVVDGRFDLVSFIWPVTIVDASFVMCHCRIASYS